MNGPFQFGGGFEGSFAGDMARISPAAVMECKICWTPYDPAIGDETRQIEPGTAFRDLPEDWTCPTCSGAKEHFMVLSDPGAAEAETQARIGELVSKLEADFTEVWNAKMRDVPIVNKLLHVEAVGFRSWEGQILGVLVSPWFMNLVLLPDGQADWSDLISGKKELIDFPSGTYEFLHNSREMIGGYKACSLFSPMGDFRSQAQAVDVAQAVLVALFDEANRAETDRSADIRAAREAELAEAEAAAQEDEAPGTLSDAPSRRAVISGGLANEDSAG